MLFEKETLEFNPTWQASRPIKLGELMGEIIVGAAPRREKWRNFHRRYRGEGAAPTYQT